MTMCFARHHVRALMPCISFLLAFGMAGPSHAQPDSIPAVWRKIDLTAPRMKVYDAPPEAGARQSPWIPVAIGAVSAGTLIYFATREKQDPTGCDFAATADVTPATCGLSNGAIGITASIPDSLEYAWSDGASTQHRTQLPAGDYAVTITRAGTTCTHVLMITVPDETITFTISLATTDPDCGRSNGAISGMADPAGTYTWSWSTGASTPDIGDLQAGAYTVTVSAGGNCTQMQSATLQEKPFDPSLQISVTPADCGSTNGTAAVTVDPPGMYDYTWSNGLGGAQVTDLAPGEYVLTVSLPETTCAKTADVIIDEAEALFTLSVSSTPAACGQADGTATVTVDPPGDYTYLWSDEQATAQANGLVAGEYSVTVTVQGTTCSKNISVTVDTLPPAFTLTGTATATPCGLAEGTASVAVDPPGDYTYLWSDGQATPTILGLLHGAYTVTVTQTGATCTKEITVIVDELPPVFTAAFDVTPADCESPNGGATITIDPPGEYVYQWSNGAVGPANVGLMAGSYTVAVTLAGTDCSKDFTVVVEQAGIAFTATISTVNADCGLANGSASAITDPPGEYSYTWSNQQTGPLLQDVLAGTYTVDITDTNGCILTLEAVVSENPPVYILPGEITPGNCLGGGEAIITLVTPGAGPIELQITTPAGTINATLPPGTVPLSSLTEVTGGLYILQAFDQQIGAECTHTIEITVPDNTPPLIAVDDTYETTAASPVEGNVLDNDSGLDLQVEAVDEIIGGTVIFDAAGDFTFTPEPGFSGDGGFTYTVTDACGSTATAQVIIVVQSGVCDFAADFAFMPATCGLPDGTITVTVDPPGSYLYSWSNGATGPSVHDVPGGGYGVTITDQNLGCDLSFETVLAENPPNNIEAPEVEQPSCNGPGEISFLALTPSGNSLEMTITHPGGTSVFVIEPGQVILSAFIPMAPGTYVVEVMDIAAGAACTETFAADLMPWQMINIVAETIIPPSTPTAMDGEATVVAVTEGQLPYMILLNDVPYGTANDHVFTVEGLGVGEHIIQVIDADGCPSNQLFIVVPPPDIVLGLTAGWQTGPVYVGGPEQPAYAGQAFGFALGASVTKWQDRWGQEINLAWMQAVSRIDVRPYDVLQAELLFKPVPWHSRTLAYEVEGGPAIRHAPGTSLVEPLLIVRADGTLRLAKGVGLSAFVGAEAGVRFLRPSAGVQVILPIRFPRSPAGIMPQYSLLDSSPFER